MTEVGGAPERTAMMAERFSGVRGGKTVPGGRPRSGASRDDAKAGLERPIEGLASSKEMAAIAGFVPGGTGAADGVGGGGRGCVLRC